MLLFFFFFFLLIWQFPVKVETCARQKCLNNPVAAISLSCPAGNTFDSNARWRASTESCLPSWTGRRTATAAALSKFQGRHMNSSGPRILSITSTRSWATQSFSKNICYPITRACFQGNSQKTGNARENGYPRMGNRISRNCCRSLVNKPTGHYCIHYSSSQLLKLLAKYAEMSSLLQMKLLFLLQTVIQRSTMPTPSRWCLSKNLYNTGRNTSRMAIRHQKGVSIWKTGTCQGISVLVIVLHNTFYIERHRYETTFIGVKLTKIYVFVCVQQGIPRTQCLHHTCLLYFWLAKWILGYTWSGWLPFHLHGAQGLMVGKWHEVGRIQTVVA